MLAGLDEVEWCDPEVAGWLRGLAAADRDEDANVWGMPASVLSDSRLGPDAVAVLPFLLRLVADGCAGRGQVMSVVGLIVSSVFETVGESERARDTIAARLAEVVALAADAEASVRIHACLVLGRCGAPAEVLRERWAVERDGRVRLALLIALGARDPAAAREVLVPAVFGEALGERLAAVLALHRAGVGLPAGSAGVVVEAVEAGATLEALTPPEHEVEEVVADTRDEDFVVGFLSGVLRPDSPGYQTGVYALARRCEASRGAPQRYVPLLRPLLADGVDQPVREAAFRAVYECGRAAGLVADELAACVEKFPEVTGEHPVTPEHLALRTLRRLNDPRWVAPLCRVWAAGREVEVFGVVGCGPVGPLVDAFEGELYAAAGRGDARVVGGLAGVIGSAAYRVEQRGELRRLAPVLRDVLPVAARPVRRVLSRLGVATDAELRALIADGGDAYEAAVELCRRTGDAGPLGEVLRRRIAGPDRDLAAGLRAALPAGVHLAGAASVVRLLLAASSVEVRVAAAHVLCRAGEPEHALAAARTGLAERSLAARYAAELARELREPSLVPLLRDRLDDQVAGLAAVEALIALGAARAEFTDRVMAWVARADRYDEIVRVCRDVLDPSAVPLLHELADRDERVVHSGEVTSAIWRDEIQREAIRAAIAAIESTG